MSKKITLTENNEELVQYFADLREADFNDMANVLIGVGYSRLKATSKYADAQKASGKTSQRAKKPKAEKPEKAEKAKSKKATKKAKDKKVKRKKASPVVVVEEEEIVTTDE